MTTHYDSPDKLGKAPKPERPAPIKDNHGPGPRPRPALVLNCIGGGAITQASHEQEANYTLVLSQTGRRFKLVGADVVESLDDNPRGDHEPRRDDYGSFPVSTPEGHAFIIHSEQLGGGRPPCSP
jgi:hypothetical protein